MIGLHEPRRNNSPPSAKKETRRVTYPIVGGVEAVYADENVWLSPQMLGLLYDVDVRTIS